VALFTSGYGSAVPAFLIGDEAGNVELPDVAVVTRISAKLQAEAEAERRALGELMDKDLSAIQLEAPADQGEEDQGDGGEEIGQSQAVAAGSAIGLRQTVPENKIGGAR
jgi:hypothetical protein